MNSKADKGLGPRPVKQLNEIAIFSKSNLEASSDIGTSTGLYKLKKFFGKD